MQERTPTHPYTCEQVLAKLDDFIDRELAPSEMRLVLAHLESCTSCAAESRFERAWIGVVRAKLQHVALPDNLMNRITRRLNDVEAEIQPAAGSAPGRGRSPQGGSRRRGRQGTSRR